MTARQPSDVRCRIARIRGSCCPVAAGVLLIVATTPAAAQEHIALHGDVLLYGDNTELANPFREGETILGSAVRVALVAGLSSTVSVTLGAFGNLRFGGDDAFEQVRPVVALAISGRRSTFVFGTLPPSPVGEPAGPDRTGPHRLLPPLQRETLAFERPYEAGLQWSFAGSQLRHEMWLNWQRVNTPAHRERLDGGLNGELRVDGPLAVPFQLHIVHQGGQLFSAGQPVADSIAVAGGLSYHRATRRLHAVALEIFGLASRYVPDRGVPTRGRDGTALLGRVSAERARWRGHVIVWRARDFIKDEGDPNYQSIARDGSEFRSTRDYAEAGVARTFKPAAGVLMEASFRIHRVEKDWGYSYRIVAVSALRWQFR